jgi:hypothetical protein
MLGAGRASWRHRMESYFSLQGDWGGLADGELRVFLVWGGDSTVASGLAVTERPMAAMAPFYVL